MRKKIIEYIEECEECGISISEDETVLTEQDAKLCFGCDSKRLIKQQ